MGTRADFYVGRGETAEWLGSLGWDGYPDGIDAAILKAKRPSAFRAAVERCLTGQTGRTDGTLPSMGWPWPWENSGTTDYAYAYDNGRVFASCFGGPWFNPLKKQPENPRGKPATFPDMSNRKNVTYGQRSGLIVVEVQK